MGGNSVFVALIKELGIYKQGAIFFGVLLILGLSGVLYYQNGLHAAAPVITDNANGAASTISLNLGPDGKLYAGNVNVGAEVFTNSSTYRYRYQVVSNPTEFINELQVTVTLPAPGTENTIHSTFINNGGAETATSQLVNPTTVLYDATSISNQAQLSIQLEVPKSMVTPSRLASLQQTLQGLPAYVWTGISIGLPVLTLVILLLVGLARVRTVAPLQEGLTDLPSRLPPALLGILAHGKLTSRELAATFVDLANRGHMVIRQFSYEDFRFRRASGRDNLADFEQLLLDQIFGTQNERASSDEITFSLAQEVFSKRVSESFILAYQQMNKLGYFYLNPLKLHLRYQLISIGLFFVGLTGLLANIFLFSTNGQFYLLGWAGMMLSALLIYYFAGGLPSRTIYGDRELSRWLSFRRYLISKEPVNYIAHSQEKYLSYLPYAIVLDAEVEWTKRFYDLPFVQPEWYVAGNIATIDQFANSLFPLFGYLSHALSLTVQPSAR